MEEIITPSPKLDPTDEQKEEITELLKTKSPCDIFIENNFPLERVVKIQEELEPVLIEPEIIDG